ncbi:MAG TPA: tRNA-uridine aminocarboxypropyltransferase [Polyangiaceae bacterium]|nr:tRNA-uridine aminocarboxypropyltransferase [Polyangiaceae bacterium]
MHCPPGRAESDSPLSGSDRPTRERCYRCHKPAATCVCASIQRVENRTRVTIFQHPRERFHPLGTVRFAELGLANSRVFVHHAHLPPPAPKLSEHAVLLYPSPRVPLVTELGFVPSELVVVDGTWHHAKTLLRDMPLLRALPRVRLAPTQPSRYRIRREPRQECVSTIEAILLALTELEPQLDGMERLLAAFDAMIEQQIRLSDPDKRRRRAPAQRRAAQARMLPRAFVECWQDLVVVYLERVPSPRGPEVVQWVAWRARDAATFEARLPIADDVADAHLLHSGLTRMLPGDSFDAAMERFRAFAGKAPMLAAWHQRTLDAAGEHFPTVPRVCVKAVHRRLHPAAAGTLEQTVAEHGLETVPISAAGRARQRLGDAVALVQHLTQGKIPAPL